MTNPTAPEAMIGEGGLAAFWQRLKERWRPAPILSADAFKVFIEERASFIAQKCAVDYCRGKTGLASYALFTEEPFLKAFDICRWEAFATLLGDLLIVAEGHLRSHVAPESRHRLGEALTALYRSVMAGVPRPVHRPHGWDDSIAAFTLQMQAACAGQPQQALDVADHSAKRLFDTLPIHLSYRELDEEVIYGAVRFRMIAVSQEMRRRMDCTALARSLITS
ncbi:MAG: hypothetical protein ACT4P8_21375 [Betaproteobacteria bacterium]